MEQPQFTLQACSKEELQLFNKALSDLLENMGLELRVQPQFVPEQSTNKFLVDAQVVVYKKVKINADDHPKEQGPREDGPNNQESKAEEPGQEETKSSSSEA